MNSKSTNKENTNTLANLNYNEEDVKNKTKEFLRKSVLKQEIVEKKIIELNYHEKRKQTLEKLNELVNVTQKVKERNIDHLNKVDEEVENLRKLKLLLIEKRNEELAKSKEAEDERIKAIMKYNIIMEEKKVNKANLIMRSSTLKSEISKLESDFTINQVKY